MRRILTIVAAFCLLLAISVSGDFRKSGFTGGLEEALPSAFFGNDTIPIFHWTFLNGMPTDVTEVGDVSVVTFEGGKVFKVNVVGGGSDYAQITIPSSWSEAWLRMNIYISDADTSGWHSGENIACGAIKNSGTDNGWLLLQIRRSVGVLKWRLDYKDDDGSSNSALSTQTLSTDTWHSVICYMKKAAGVGIINLKIDGTEVLAVADWDNGGTTYNRFHASYVAGTLDCIYYIDDVKLWTPEGLP